MSLRILLVEYNEDGTVGGSHQALFDLAVRLRRWGHDPVVLFYQANQFIARLRDAGVTVELFRGAQGPDGETARRWWHVWSVVSAVHSLAGCVAVVRRLRPHVVHVNNVPGRAYYNWLPAARLHGVPIVSHLRMPPGRLRTGLRQWLLSRFDGYVAVSAHIARQFVAAGLASSRIVVVPDGVDAQAQAEAIATTPEAVRASLGTGSRILAVMVGHLKAWKGQHLVLEAIAGLPTAQRCRLQVVFVGGEDPSDTSYAEGLRASARAAGYGDGVLFLGSRNDVPTLMAASDVVLHASTTPEPFGLVVLEALALGKPVFASSLGGPAEIVRDDSGWLFDPLDASALRDLLAALIDEPEQFARVRERALCRADALSADASALGVLAVYHRLLGEDTTMGMLCRSNRSAT